MHAFLIDDRIFAKILLILRYVYIYIMEDVQPPPFHPGHLFPSSLPRAGPTLPSPSVFFSVVKDPVPVGRPCATSKSRPSSRGRRLLNDANHLPRWRGTRAAATRQLQPNDDAQETGQASPISEVLRVFGLRGYRYPKQHEDERAPRFSNLPSTPPLYYGLVDCSFCTIVRGGSTENWRTGFNKNYNKKSERIRNITSSII